jgi:hypothetical protein
MMYRELAHAIAAQFHAEHLSTWEPPDGKMNDCVAFVFRLTLARIVPDSHRAGWSDNIYVGSRQRTYFLEVYVPTTMLSVDWLRVICDQIEQHLRQLTFVEENATLKIIIAPAAATAGARA